MQTSLLHASIADEYTQKAQNLYEALEIDSIHHLTIDEISQEYEKCLQLMQKQNIETAVFYASR